MEPRSEQGTKHGSSAWHATANHPECSKNYEWNPGAYGRDRMADYNLKCRVSLLRVHVRNSNKMCDGNNRCALKKFDILSEEAGWAYIGRFMMPDPGTTVGSKLFSQISQKSSELWQSSTRDFHFQSGWKRNPIRGRTRCICGWSS